MRALDSQDPRRAVLRTFAAIVATLFVSVVIPAVPNSARAATANQAAAGEALDGTFMQLRVEHGDWERADWERLFGYLRDIHMRRLIVQWSAHDAIRFYRFGPQTALKRAPLELLLQLAEASDMEVLVGLTQESTYWKDITGTPKDVEATLQRLRASSLEVARELLPIVSARRSFAGWYISEEIDDVNWREPARRKLLLAHLAALTTDLKKLVPTGHIGISGFSNATMDPGSFETLWAQLLDAAPPIDTVFFQDGVGTNKLAISEALVYLEALDRAAQPRGRQLVAVVELFKQVAGPPIDQRDFAAVPAPLGRIREQITSVRSLASRVVAFSVPEYLTPLGGPEAEAVYNDYRAAIGSNW
jgi:hypothetical protein